MLKETWNLTDFDISLNNADRAESQWYLAAGKLKEVLQQQLHELLVNIVAEARSNLQNNTTIVTGNLLSSIKIIEEGDLKGKVGTMVAHAVYVEYGRGIVRPKVKQVLHWIDPETGKDVFAMMSKEFEGAPFLEPAVITESKDFASTVIEALNKFLQ